MYASNCGQMVPKLQLQNLISFLDARRYNLKKHDLFNKDVIRLVFPITES